MLARRFPYPIVRGFTVDVVHSHIRLNGSIHHALVGLALLVVAYLRKTRLEDQILAQTFGAEFDAYRQDTWALVPLLF